MANLHTDDHEPAGAGRELGGMRVLLAEDSWHVAYAIQTVLEHAGAVVLGPAATVADLDRLAAQERFDAVVADINLHGELSSGALEALARRGVPVVVITGYGESPPMVPRAATTLQKPVAADDLIAALRNVAGRR
jgi:CheY-like chemotaxis protein